jgi:hypothetical protein
MVMICTNRQFSSVLFFLIVSATAYYSDVKPGECPVPPVDPIIPKNNTRLYFIGPHHTGTTAYIKAFFELKSKLKLPLTQPGHEMHWAYSLDKKIYKFDIIADTPYRDWDDENGLEFGHPSHPDVRTLFNCFPNSLYVINTRQLLGYLKTKVTWELGFHGNPSPPCQTAAVYASDPFHFALSKAEKTKTFLAQNAVSKKQLSTSLKHPNASQFPLDYMSKICQVAYVRERLYLAFLNFINEDLIHRQPRFLITDIEKEGLNNIMRRICKFVHIYKWSSLAPSSSFDKKKNEVLGFCDGIEFPPPKAKQHQSLYANSQCEAESFQYVIVNGTGHNAPATFSNKRATKVRVNACHKFEANFTLDGLLNDSNLLLFPGTYKDKYHDLVNELSTRYQTN